MRNGGSGKKDLNPESSPRIDDYEFQRLHLRYLERKDPNRRASERVERPVDVKPMYGGRIVAWNEYLAMVERGEAKYPPTHHRSS